MSTAKIIVGDSVAVLASWPANSIDAICADPPYGLSFMGQAFDKLGGPDAQKAWHARWAAEAFRVCKPGAHVVAFGGQRTIHHLTVALEGVGFTVRELYGWLQWQGFPKSTALDLAIDRHLGRLADREVVGERTFKASNGTEGILSDYPTGPQAITAPATPEAEAAAGWGSALKPCLEPAIIVRKPLADAEGRPLTLAANWLLWGTGGLNIDATRHPYNDKSWPGPQESDPWGGQYIRSGNGIHVRIVPGGGQPLTMHPLGRWPANVYACPACDCPSWPGPDGPSGWAKSGTEGNPAAEGFAGSDTFRIRERTPDECQPSPLGRFPSNVFATPKPSRSERDAGCEGLAAITGAEAVERKEGSAGLNSPRAGAGRTASEVLNFHSTVKPWRLMAQLVKLITPIGGTVVDPFCGSGTTAVAAVLEGYDVIGIELDPDYARIAEARVRWAVGERRRSTAQGDLFAPAPEAAPTEVVVEVFEP